MQLRQLTSAARQPVAIVNVLLVAFVVAAGGWAYTIVHGSGTASAAAATTSATHVAATTRDVTATVSSSGTVASSDVVNANFTTSGTVTKIYVKLGQHVTKGQKLARIDATTVKQQLKTAKDNLTAAEDSLTRAKAGGDTTSIDSAQLQVDSAEDAVTTATAAVAGAVLTAPISGTIIAQNGVIGATSGSSGSSSGSGGGNGSNAASSSSSSSSGFMQIANLSKMEIDTDFAEADATKLKVGQAVRVTWNALTGATATGKVASIDPTATTSNNVVSYGVVVQLTTLPAGIRIGQTTSVVVTTGSAPGALAVPATSVTTTNGRSIVIVVKNGVNTPTEVTIGVVGDSYTEIKSGLAEGDEVVVPQAKVSATGTSTNPFSGGGLGGFGGGTGGFGGGAGGFGGGGNR